LVTAVYPEFHACDLIPIDNNAVGKKTNKSVTGSVNIYTAL